MRVRRWLLLAGVVVLAGCAGSATRTASAPPSTWKATAAQQAFLDTLAERTFRWFWDLSDARTGLTPDRWPTRSFISIAATGFALTAYPIGAERGWVTRVEARDRTLATLRFLWRARQDTARQGATGYRGFYYHFLHPEDGTRFRDVELSTVDTALLLGGVLFCQSYFDRSDAAETEVRALADSIYLRVDWPWAMPRSQRISHGWIPETGFIEWDWLGYNESMLVPILALGSPRHDVGKGVWSMWVSPCRWQTYRGIEHVSFPPLFGHQYSHVWIDFDGIQDSLMRAHDSDWFENSRRATLAQRAYAIANPGKFRGYGERLWGLTACDGPHDTTMTIDGMKRTFRTYSARGAPFHEDSDDGTIAPTAAGGSIPFAPEIAVPVLMAMREDWGVHAYNRYGFVDAFNPTLNVAMRSQHGTVVPGVGWFDGDQLGIDQGPILAMIENQRSGLVWRTMRRNPYVVRGLRRAGFSGGWLDKAPR